MASRGLGLVASALALSALVAVSVLSSRSAPTALLLRHSRLASVAETRQNVWGSLAAMDKPFIEYDRRMNKRPLKNAGVNLGDDMSMIKSARHAAWEYGTAGTNDDFKLERHGVRMDNGFLRSILPYPGLEPNAPHVTHPRSPHGASTAHLRRAGVKVGELNVGDNLVRARPGVYAYIDGPAGLQRTEAYWDGIREDAPSRRKLGGRFRVESHQDTWKAIPHPSSQATPPAAAKSLPRTHDHTEDSGADFLSETIAPFLSDK